MVRASWAAWRAVASFEADLPEILDRYGRELDERRLLCGSEREAVMHAARTVADECVRTLRSLCAEHDEQTSTLPLLHRLAVCTDLPPRESVRAAHLLCAMFTTALMDAFGNHGPVLLRAALLRLNELVGDWTQTAVTSAETSALKELREGQRQDRLAIAREIHDEIGSVLALALRNLDLHDYYEEQGFYARSEEKAVTLRQVLMSGVDISRRLVRDLREPLPVPDIETALNTLVEVFDDPATAVNIKVEGDQGLVPSPVRYQIYTMVRECLRNSLTYSRSDSVSIFIRVGETEVVAVVEDDGKGLDPELAIRDEHKFGLRSMVERAEIHGGHVLISSAPGAGTRVEIALPLRKG